MIDHQPAVSDKSWSLNESYMLLHNISQPLLLLLTPFCTVFNNDAMFLALIDKDAVRSNMVMWF
jgi:hypothetical protein